MKNLLSALFLLVCWSVGATSYTEFYCNTTGTNINAGSTTNATPTFSATGGDWVATTGVWTKAGANPVSGGVTVGSWASVFADNATTPVFIGRVTAADDTADTITVSVTIKTGTAPADGTGTRSIRIGGAWYGPYFAGATVETFPFSLVNNLMTNTSLNETRINLKNDRIYSTTNLVFNSNGPIRLQGFGTNAGDLGRAWITGSTVGSGHNLFTTTGPNLDLVDLTFATNGTTSSSSILWIMNGSECFAQRCVFRDSRGPAFVASGILYIEESEAFLCNAGNAVQGIAQLTTSGSVATRCMFHDNAGTGSSGVVIGSGVATLLDCVLSGNGRNGVEASSTISAYIYGCDFYNNVTNGINLTGASASSVVIENCNFFQNGVGLTGAYAINSSGSTLHNGAVINCAFGTGTTTNGSGNPNLFPGTGLDEIGSFGLAANATPWTAPSTGDFRPSSTSPTIAAGRGSFLQTQAGFTGTTSYVDVGSAQLITNGAAGGTTVIAYPLFRR